MREILILVIFSIAVQTSAAQILTHPLLSQQQVAELESRVLANPDDLDGRRALLQYYADSAQFGGAPARRFARLQQILYLIAHHPADQVTGTPLAYVARATGPYANESDHATAMNQWMAAIDSHPGDNAVLLNAVRFLTVEEKTEAENVLQRALAAAPGDREIAANLGFLYAIEILGSEYAAHATTALGETSNAVILAGAGTAIPNMAMSASAGRPVDPKLFELSGELQKRARLLAPDDKDIQGPMPVINYFSAARDQMQGVVKPPAPSRIRVSGTVAAAQLIRKTAPVYPEQARVAGITGDVKFTAVIGRDGSIQTLQLIGGHPLLVAAAQSAVLTWLYKPTLLNGDPVEVTTEITVTFLPADLK